MRESEVPDLVAVLRRTRYLLLDFDGPICAIFAGRPAPDLASELVAALRDDGVPVPTHVAALSDPFAVLRFAKTISAAAAEQTHARLQSAELEAALSATPTPHTAEVIGMWRDAGRIVAVVSNNSQAAVSAYLVEHDIELDLVVGRTSADPALLKPSPHLVARAIDALGAAVDESVFVGDSPSDIDAGAKVGLATIGYANKPGKHLRLADAGARHVIDDIRSLASALQSAPFT